MTKKKPSKPRKADGLRVRFDFQFGEVDRLAASEVTFQFLAESARMFTSESRALREVGRQRLKVIASELNKANYQALVSQVNGSAAAENSKDEFIVRCVADELANNTPARKINAAVAGKLNLTPQYIGRVRKRNNL